MSDIVQELRAMQGMGDVQLKALMDGVGPQGAEEIKRLRAELAETRANYEQYGAAMGQNLEDRDTEIERLRAELDAMKTTWLSPDSYDTLMQERKETLQEIAGLRAELDALKAWKEEVEKQGAVAEVDRRVTGYIKWTNIGVIESHRMPDGTGLYAYPVPAPSVPGGWQLVPKEVADLYSFMCSAFVPMTRQQEEIAKQLDLAKQAMKAAPKPEVKR